MNINHEDAVLIQKMIQSLQAEDNQAEYTAVLNRLSNKPGINYDVESFMNDSTNYTKLT